MKRRARPPRYFIIKLKDPFGMRVDYMTGEYKLKDLIDKYGQVTDYLHKAGFDQVSADGAITTKTPLESTTASENKFCGTCGKQMTFKQGVSKTSGKPWKGYFCEEKGHDPIWIK